MASPKIRISYNAPITLSFCFIAVTIYLVDITVFHGSRVLFAILCCKSNSAGVIPFNPTVIFDYARLFTHVLVHADLSHLMSNMPLILLLGPILEARYSRTLLLMIAVTAFVTGILNICFLTTALCGASGIVYMMILLAAFQQDKAGTIPLSFILVFVLYLGSALMSSGDSRIATFAHVAGGLCGSLFAFMTREKGHTTHKSTTTTGEGNIG